jgi:hypothetical protein
MEPDSAAGPALALAPARASALATDRVLVTGPASGQASALATARVLVTGLASGQASASASAWGQAAAVAAHQVWKRPTDPL